jgi:hypothetical protein
MDSKDKLAKKACQWLNSYQKKKLYGVMHSDVQSLTELLIHVQRQAVIGTQRRKAGERQ